MYTERITIFIDILGFKNIVNQTERDNEFALKIFDVLNSLKTSNLQNELFVGINALLAKGEEELEALKALQAKVSHKLISGSSIQITHFSDSIVMSIGLENEVNAMSLFEYLSRLNYSLWKNFKILLRGGCAVGKLVHIENGALLGPGLVAAYDFESKLAIYPRIILDNWCYRIVNNSQSYEAMKYLFKDFSDRVYVKNEVTEIIMGLEINLITSLNHLSNSPFCFSEEAKRELVPVIKSLPRDLTHLMSQTKDQRIIEKYGYLLNEFQSTKFPDYCSYSYY